MGGSRVGHYGRIQGGSLWEDPGSVIMGDPGWVIMGESRVGYHGRIQGGSSWEDPGWVIIGGSKSGPHLRIQDRLSLEAGLS